MTRNQAETLKGYFMEFPDEEYRIEARLFCESRSDNAILGRLKKSSLIEDMGGSWYEKINGRKVKNTMYKLTEKGLEEYLRLI